MAQAQVRTILNSSVERVTRALIAQIVNDISGYLTRMQYLPYGEGKHSKILFNIRQEALAVSFD